MNKDEAKKILREIICVKGDECSNCPLEEDNFPEAQFDVDYYLQRHGLVDISVCSSRLLYLCLRYNKNILHKFVDYAKKITGERTVFHDRCPCYKLKDLSKYLLGYKELLNIE